MTLEPEDELINHVEWSDFFEYAMRIHKKLEDSQNPPAVEIRR